MKVITAKKQSKTIFGESAPVINREERRNLGRSAWQKVPHAKQGIWKVPASTRDPLEILEASNADRVPELIPIRYGRMLASPFTFYRGSAAVMASDLSYTASSGIEVQCCGDCHILNFGAFATPERNIIVDMNDFDETLRGPWEWDVKRLATSLVLAARSSGFSDAFGRELAQVMGQAYREQMAEYSKMSILDVWYSRLDFQTMVDRITESELRKRSTKFLEDAIKKSSPETLLTKLTESDNGRVRFKDMPPLVYHSEMLDRIGAEKAGFESYRQSLGEERRALLDKFEIVDIALKVVGIGSVGTRCFVVLLAGSEADVLILQVKEARPSVLEPYVGKSQFPNHGQRIVVGQKVMQSASDLFLGWTRGRGGRHFYVRQLRDVKMSPNPAYWDKATLSRQSHIAGIILAKAHARSGDPAVLRGYLGKTDEFEIALSKFAVAYADQTEADHQRFVKACRSGKLKAEVIA